MADDQRAKVEMGVKTFLEKDHDLLRRDVNEKTITAKLAFYLAPLFPDWDVDCEYNRNLEDAKKLAWKQPHVLDLVVPDIIIHKRGTEENFLVIEVKKLNTQGRGDDKKKLTAFKEQLGYKNTLFLTLSTKQEPFRAEYEWG
jgi:hypothetical protein